MTDRTARCPECGAMFDAALLYDHRRFRCVGRMMRRGGREAAPPYEREDDPALAPDSESPAPKYSRAWNRDRLGVSGDRDE